jgi:RHS repeat-associated protein
MRNIGETGTRLEPPDSDTENCLYYHRARYYDPTAGRFLNEDPISFAAGIDFYAYAKNSPLNLVDPTGLAQTPNPKLPTVPTGKAGCQFVQEVDTGGPCKNCVYKCRGYGALVVFPQAVGKPCPSIDPVSGLVRTDEIDPSCREPEKKCEPEKKKEPAPKPKKPWWYWFFWNVFVFE